MHAGPTEVRRGHRSPELEVESSKCPHEPSLQPSGGIFQKGTAVPQEELLLKLRLGCISQVSKLLFSPVASFSKSPQLLISLKEKVLLSAMESKTTNSQSHAV